MKNYVLAHDLGTTGGVGVGLYPDFSMIETMNQVAKVIEPDPAAQAAYEQITSSSRPLIRHWCLSINMLARKSVKQCSQEEEVLISYL